MSSSIKGQFPYKVVFHQRSSSIKLSLYAKFQICSLLPVGRFWWGLHVAEEMLHGLSSICCMVCRGYVACAAEDRLSCNRGKTKLGSGLKTEV